ncbi:hypothetical protein DSM43518_04831 [Mycobacterium marinum]|uniref:hypothetical protein n=1 Tax=Mycobacterium marinum TaxID=1781 RepID=UPI000CD9B95C|nr:hypothetical protein [Mycobacterium marinum]AXN51289.1 hypothetical protein CCUG20998_03893 [Mycobacterium marinum]RFZ02844.1 hypothetical protein DSM43518_04831 [Mycobacterium marinum]RFZ26035.1 hypothetical protein DSM43519_01349 [Mycobacterium marinum]RFZ28914.1 hypothetical protein DSM44344_01181 [Mycobacterium marinum]RFZ39100.1 hypothetical protein NCTC2275_00368 [Mycobacterium marinum]
MTALIRLAAYLPYLLGAIAATTLGMSCALACVGRWLPAAGLAVDTLALGWASYRVDWWLSRDDDQHHPASTALAVIREQGWTRRRGCGCDEEFR